MNKEILELLEFIKIFNHQGVLEDEFKALAETLKDEKDVTLTELLRLMNDEISYWEFD